MVSEKDTDPPKNGVGHPPQPRPLIIRIFRAFKRYESRRRRQNREYAKQHPFYEMMMARWTRRVGIYTFGLILVGLLTCYVIWNQLQSSELEQRPWLNFSSFEINAGFTVDNENVYFDTKYSLVNTGKLPATMTNVYFRMRPSPVRPGAENKIADEVQEDQREVCRGTLYNSGDTVFPSQPPAEPHTAIISAKKAEFDYVSTFGPIFAVMITGCATYIVASDWLWSHRGHTGATILVGHPHGTLPLTFNNGQNIRAVSDQVA